MGDEGGLPGAKPPGGILSAHSKYTEKKKKNIYIYRMAKFIRVCQYNVAQNPDDLFGQPIIYIYIYKYIYIYIYIGKDLHLFYPFKKDTSGLRLEVSAGSQHTQKGGPAR